MAEIVIAGAGILDVLVYPVSKTVFETGSEPVRSIRLSTGGDALNEATVLARLGKRPDLITVLGEDDAAALIRSHCAREGISLSLTKSSAAVETGVNIVMIEEDGSRSFFTNPKGTLRLLAPCHMPEQFPEDAGIFCLASMFVSPLLGTQEMAELFQKAGEQGLLVCADMTKCKNHETARELSGVLSRIDYLFANDEEAALLTARETPEAMAEELLRAGAKTVVIKCGGRGCFVKNQEFQWQFPAVPDTRCVDTTGAGDAFVAGFLCALSEGKDLPSCAKWANACGSLAVESVGSGGILRDRRQVQERIF